MITLNNDNHPAHNKVVKIIKTFLINSFNYSFDHNNLTELQKQGLITLIPKQCKDSTLLANWRPITLLNVDFKIATKSMANRIKPILKTIISSSQTGFIRGRYIGENIRLLSELLEHIEDNNIQSILFFSDFEKAFDSLDHAFMFKSLKHFNFGDDFLNWVKLFYSDSKSCVLNNGHMTDFFNIKRGVRQGCPLSPYLFIICIELLSHEISSNNNIKGVRLGDHEVKNILFADDATFVTDGSIKSFENLIGTLDNFSLASGLKLNTSKCVVLRAGSLKNTETKYLRKRNFLWNSESAKALGITFYTDTKLIYSKNFDTKLESFQNCLKSWMHRKLSLLGKITVIKSLAIPKLVYPLTVLVNPTLEHIKAIKQSMFSFIWDNKPDKIKRDVLIKDYKLGGLKMLDIDMFINSLKGSWIKRIYDNDNPSILKQYYQDLLNKHGGDIIFKSKVDSAHINHMFPKNLFLQQIITSWIKITQNQGNQNISSIGKEIIWHNQSIKLNKKSLFYQSWYERGIQNIEHIYDYRQKEFYNFQDLSELYNIPSSNFLKYHQLLVSIPKLWKDKLKTESINPTSETYLFDNLAKTKKVNRFLYSFQLKHIPQLDIKSHVKWSQTFQEDDLNWSEIHSLPFNSTIDSKLRNVQYKYIMRIIPTNKLLLKFKIKSTNLCDFCCMYIESLDHLFWYCSHIQHFWNEFTHFLKTLNVNIQLNLRTVSLGITDNVRNKIAINYILICAKYFIFINKCLNNIPKFPCFKNYFKRQIDIEKAIAQRNDKLVTHDNKWKWFKIIP